MFGRPSVCVCMNAKAVVCASITLSCTKHRAPCVRLMSHAGINTSKSWPAIFFRRERQSPSAKKQLCCRLEHSEEEKKKGLGNVMSREGW